MHPLKAGITTGTTLTSSSASSNAAIPNDATGNTARHVIITATGSVHIKFGTDNTVAATANDLMAVADEMLFFDVRGLSYVACLEETAGAKVTIAPVES